MKFTQTTSFARVLLFSLMSTIACTSNRAILARDSSLSPSVAEKFYQIDQTIQKLEEGERKPKQGNPDFSRATGELIQLSIQAEEAKDLLTLMMQSKLDQQSSAKIDQSLKSSADGVGVITELDKQGKEYFQKNNITGIIVQILQVELYEFRDLFNALNKHALPQYADSYKRSETKFICDIVSAIQVLDPSKVSPSDVQRCASGNYFSDPGNDGQVTQPPGWSGCSKSAATFFTNAYAHNTIGTSNTMCGPKVPTSQFVLPFNVFPNL